jgi:hypothetical protein
MRFAFLPPCYKDRKGELIPIVDVCFEILERSNIPSIHKNDAAFLQGEILLEDALPGPLVMSLKSDEYLSQGRGVKVQRDGSLQNKFCPEYVRDDRHG